MKQTPGRGVCGTLLASMENALAVEVTTDGADDRAGHGESHEQNGEKGNAQDKDKVVDLTCFMNTIIFCCALFVSFVLNFLCFFLSFLDVQEKRVQFCSVLFPCVFLLFFFLISGVFWCFLACFLWCYSYLVRRHQLVCFFPRLICDNIGFSDSVCDHIICISVG